VSHGQRDHRLLISSEPFDPAGVAASRPPSAASRTGSPEPVIVQFTAPLTLPDADRLKAAYGGLRLDRYVPNLAYLERVPNDVLDRLREDFLVRACLPLEPSLKVAPWLSPPAGPFDIVVDLIAGADAEAVRADLVAAGARDVRAFDDQVWCTLDDPAGLAGVTAVAEVVWVEPATVAKPFDVRSARMTQSGTVGNAGNPIWDKGLHGEGQIIGVIDERTFDVIHGFFFDPGGPAPGPNHRKILANFQGIPNLAESDHFMFVAGIAAGDSWIQPGLHPHRGGAWAARLVCASYWDLKALGSLYAMLDRARKLDARIHNLSWGDAFLDGKVVTIYNKTCRELDKFSWDHEDQLVVCAGANTTEADNSPPGIAKNSLCVACAEAHPNHMNRGSGISGPTNPDRRRKPEIMAVGCDIESALLDPSDKQKTGLLTTRDRCSTSWAAPNVSAAAALVRQYFTEGWYPAGSPDRHFSLDPTGALIKAVLLNSTVDMTGHAGYPSPVEGWGLIQLDRALYFAGARRRLAIRDVRNEYGMASGEARTHYLYVGDSAERLKITLVWTDPPAAPLTRSPAINNIQLTVTDPAGGKYRGNDIDPNIGLSRRDGTGPPDTVNNVHMVIVDNPPVGMWRLTTQATVAQGKTQGFALVATGGLVMNIVVQPGS